MRFIVVWFVLKGWEAKDVIQNICKVLGSILSIKGRNKNTDTRCAGSISEGFSALQKDNKVLENDSAVQCLQLIQRTRVWFPTPTSDSSQPPVNYSSRKS